MIAIDITYSSLFALASGIGIALAFLPWIIRISHKLRWADEPVARSVHRSPVPTSGGLAIMATPLLVAFGWHSIALAGALVLLVFMGFHDDRKNASPKLKIIIQLLAAFLVVHAGFRLTSFGGLWGIGELDLFWQYAVSVILLTGLSNAYNLMDGLDGLAGSLGLVISTLLGFGFLLAGATAFALLAFALAGGILGFLRFNWHPAKIFMGDAGSLPIGFLLGVLGIQLLQPSVMVHLPAISYELVLLGLFWLPVFDTARVVAVRLRMGESPFKADKNHLHHRLIDLGCGHRGTTCVLVGLQLSFLVVAICIAKIYPNWTALGLAFTGVAFSQVIHLLRMRQLGLTSQAKPKGALPSLVRKSAE